MINPLNVCPAPMMLSQPLQMKENERNVQIETSQSPISRSNSRYLISLSYLHHLIISYILYTYCIHLFKGYRPCRRPLESLDRVSLGSTGLGAGTRTSRTRPVGRLQCFVKFLRRIIGIKHGAHRKIEQQTSPDSLRLIFPLMLRDRRPSTPNKKLTFKPYIQTLLPRPRQRVQNGETPRCASPDLRTVEKH